jgi:hypothetical protein
MINFQQEGYLLSATAPGLIENSEVHPRDHKNELQRGHTYTIV